MSTPCDKKTLWTEIRTAATAADLDDYKVVGKGTGNYLQLHHRDSDDNDLVHYEWELRGEFLEIALHVELGSGDSSMRFLRPVEEAAEQVRKGIRLQWSLGPHAQSAHAHFLLPCSGDEREIAKRAVKVMQQLTSRTWPLIGPGCKKA